MASLLETSTTDSVVEESSSRVDRFRSRRCSETCPPLIPEEVRQAKFFYGRSHAFITTVVDFFQLETYIEGECIMKEGEKGDKLVFLYRGKVDVLIGQNEHKVASLNHGSVFGEMALLGSPKRTATIRAAEFCDCRVLDKHTFQRLLRKFPDERAYFEQMARERMEQLEQAKTDNSGDRRNSFRLPTLHAEGKQRLRKSALPKACQTAVDKFLAIRQKTAGGISTSRRHSEVAPRIKTDPALNISAATSSDDETTPGRILTSRRHSEVAPRIKTEPALYTSASTSSDDGENSENKLLEVVGKFRASHATTPRIHTDSSFFLMDAICDEKACQEDAEEARVRALLGNGAKQFLACRRRTSLPLGEIDGKETHGLIPNLNEEDRAFIRDSRDAASTCAMDRHSDIGAHSGALDCTMHEKGLRPQAPRFPNFRRRLKDHRRPCELPPSGMVHGDFVDHKNLLYNIVACAM